MAAIVSAVRARRWRQATIEVAAPGASRWAIAGRREAMIGRDVASADPSDRR